MTAFRPRRSKTRDIVRRRAGGRCERCSVQFNKNKNKSNASMHHRQPRRMNGYDSVGNLLHLCLDCHADIHRHEDAAGLCGWITWSIPEATPVMIAGRRWAYLLEDGSYEFLSESEAIETIESLMNTKETA